MGPRPVREAQWWGKLGKDHWRPRHDRRCRPAPAAHCYSFPNTSPSHHPATEIILSVILEKLEIVWIFDEEASEELAYQETARV